MQSQKAAVDAGQWLLYRYHPEREARGENPLQLDSRSPKIPLEDFMYRENRFKMLTKSHPDDARRMLQEAQRAVQSRWRFYEFMATRRPSGPPPAGGGAPDSTGESAQAPETRME